MVVLKRIKGSTLMETMVATVLIVIIFMMSSLLLNASFSNTIKARNHHIKEKLHQLQYEYLHANIQMPYYEDMGDWELSITTRTEKGMQEIVFKAENQKNDNLITSILINEE